MKPNWFVRKYWRIVRKINWFKRAYQLLTDRTNLSYLFCLCMNDIHNMLRKEEIQFSENSYVCHLRLMEDSCHYRRAQKVQRLLNRIY